MSENENRYVSHALRRGSANYGLWPKSGLSPDNENIVLLEYNYVHPFTIVYNLSLEKAMATHSSTLAWKISWAEEPGGLQSMGLLGVGHD